LIGLLLRPRIEPFLRIVIPTSARRLDNQNGVSFENSQDSWWRDVHSQTNIVRSRETAALVYELSGTIFRLKKVGRSPEKQSRLSAPHDQWLTRSRNSNRLCWHSQRLFLRTSRDELFAFMMQRATSLRCMSTKGISENLDAKVSTDMVTSVMGIRCRVFPCKSSAVRV